MINTNGEPNEFYRRTLEAVTAAGIPFMIGGAFALDYSLGTNRRTKDLDILVKPDDIQPTLDVLAAAGYRTELTDPNWIGKAFCAEDFVDVIFGFGNGLAKVDDSWFPHAADGQLWGVPAKFCPLEESMWSKAFVMERDRFDGADVAHVIRLKGQELDWERLVQRFGPKWRVLLAHLILFGFVYPGERERIPGWVMRDLLRRLATEAPSNGEDTCFGGYLSRYQYAYDFAELGMADARAAGEGERRQSQTAGAPFP